MVVFRGSIEKLMYLLYLSEDILNWHCLSLSLNANLCIHFYWLSRLRQASHRKMVKDLVYCDDDHHRLVFEVGRQ